jgi:hypothetical protein
MLSSWLLCYRMQDPSGAVEGACAGLGAKGKGSSLLRASASSGLISQPETGQDVQPLSWGNP